MRRPKGVLLDYGGTLLEEVGYDLRAGTAALLAHATHLATGVTLDVVVDRAKRVSRELAARRDQFGIETQWPALTRLIHDYFGTRFGVRFASCPLGKACRLAASASNELPFGPSTMSETISFLPRY